MANDNPLLKALPPAVDYLSYLTILEYNLTLEQLPLLHEILQDTTLTANIGWDLVHLLLPLLPESQSCLQDVARLGNPREVVLKATELLEAIVTPDGCEHEDEEEEEEEEEEHEQEQEEEDDEQQRTDGHERAKDSAPDKHPAGTAIPFKQDTSPAVLRQAGSSISRKGPSKVSQFSALLDMLAILHPRIKTKYPSRFLSTSLQAVLPAYAALAFDIKATDAVLSFINTFAGTKRPRLPPRYSSTQVSTQPAQLPRAAPDPEASEEPMAPEEIALQERLLQSFLTFVAEGYMSALPVDDDVPALSWSTRLLEHLYPDRIIPGRRAKREAFEKDGTLHHRDSTIGRMLALTRDLNLPIEDVCCTVVEPDSAADEDSTDLPASASEVPLSRPGCLYLLCASYASAVLFSAPSHELRAPLESTFFSLLANCFGDPSSATLGSEPVSLIDCLLFLGHYNFERKGLEGFLDRPENDSTFTRTLQYFSILSANTPSAILRYNAHLLTSKILHAHPNDQLRLSFIKDTLEHCPYENLKASAVGWLKDEILAANTSSLSNAADQSFTETDADNKNVGIFAKPTCIATLAPHLFISPMSMATKDEFQAHESFFLATLNLYYLLLSREGLKEGLNLQRTMDEVSEFEAADGGWLGLMEKGVRRFEDVGEEREGEEEDMGKGKGMSLLEGVIAMCKEKGG
ncbi:MAG: hypothetical protein Q9171_005884 [Xanthocarpia ochracea]